MTKSDDPWADAKTFELPLPPCPECGSAIEVRQNGPVCPNCWASLTLFFKLPHDAEMPTADLSKWDVGYLP